MYADINVYAKAVVPKFFLWDFNGQVLVLSYDSWKIGRKQCRLNLEDKIPLNLNTFTASFCRKYVLQLR